MTRDFADFLASLRSEGAAYVVIGGMAVLSYIPDRATRSFAVLIERTIPAILLLGGTDPWIRAWS
jgi:hypothetical protein